MSVAKNAIGLLNRSGCTDKAILFWLTQPNHAKRSADLEQYKELKDLG